MTLRLVALMSVVLLLCLGAFGLVVNYFQDQVMAEVAHTASAAGQAALRTFELREMLVDGPPVPGQPAGVVVWHSADEGEAEIQGGTVVVDLEQDPRQIAEHVGLDHEQIRELMYEARSRPNFVSRRVVTHSTPAGEWVVECSQSAAEEENCVTSKMDGDVTLQGNVFIQLDAVRAEADAADGLVLKIPRFVRQTARNEPLAEVEAVLQIATDDSGRLHSSFDEIHMPISVEEYGDLFASIRRRSLFVFLGVFLIGTVLSTGLAARVTRPLRRLDSGIRRLSEGDLDVQVEVQGKDEVARLGRAFNDMALSLRANRERSREMVRREKHSALGRLAAGVAHDVRNPLHSIGLTLQHLQETGRPESDSRAAEFDRSLDIIRGEIRRLDGLVGTFLRFAATDQRERQSINLAQLLQEMRGLIQKEAEWRQVELELDIDEAVPEIEADGEAIRSAVLNLVLNSFEALPEGGRLTLRLRSEQDEILLDVEDNGKGIPAEDRDRVFEFAYTTREGGNGLGLALVHQCIVDDHGGRVSLESEPGEGTRVRLALPRPGAEKTN